MPLAIALVFVAACFWDLGRRYLARDTKAWREELANGLRVEAAEALTKQRADIMAGVHSRAVVDAALKQLAEQFSAELSKVTSKQVALLASGRNGANTAVTASAATQPIRRGGI